MTQGAQNDTPPPNYLDIALSYASRGWTVFPAHYAIHAKGLPPECSCVNAHTCKDMGKHPAVSSGFYAATNNVAKVERWWTDQPLRNVCLRTGRRAAFDDPEEEGGGFIVVEVDQGLNASGIEKHGLKELEVASGILGPLPPTMTARSGGGGYHYFLKHPGNIYIPNRGGLVLFDADGVEVALNGVQVRGDGGYVVAWPSMHRSGKRYTWVEGLGPGQIEIASLPEKWLSQLQAPNPKEDGARIEAMPVPEGNWPPLPVRIKRARVYVEKMPIAIQGERGSDKAFLVAVKLVRGFALPLPEAYAIFRDIYNPRCQPPWSDWEIKKKIEDAHMKGRMPYGSAFAKDVEWALEKEEERLAQVIQLRPPRSAAPAGEVADVAEAAATPAPRREVEEEPPSGPRAPPGPAPTAANDTENGGGGGGGGNGGGGNGGAAGGGAGQVHRHFILGDHVELAQAILEHAAEGGRPVIFDEGSFWRYSPALGLWENLSHEWVMATAGMFSGCPLGEDKVMKIRDSDARGALTMLRSHLIRTPTPYNFINTVTGVAFRNGFLRVDVDLQQNICNVTFLPHDAGNMARHRINADWSEEVQPAPMLARFFDVLFSDVEDAEERRKREWLIQEFLGVCLVGLAPKFEKCLFLEGPGSNGKSQVLALVRSLFPPAAVSSVAPHDWGKQFLMEKTIGALVNLCPDISSNDMKDDQQFKQFVTGDPIQIDRKYKDPISFFPRFGSWMAANNMPPSKDSSGGFWRRVIVLPLTARLEHRPDKIVDIGEKVGTQEAAQVVAWAIAGLRRVVDNGRCYTTPAATTHRVSEWRTDSDEVRSYLIDFMPEDTFAIMCSKQGITVADLHRAFLVWADEQGNGSKNTSNHLTLNAFGRRITANSDVAERRGNGAQRRVWATEKLANERLRRQAESDALKAAIELP